MSAFKNKVAIVTGGTGALGSVIVNKFAEQGMKVYVPVLHIQKFREVFDNSVSGEDTFTLRKIFALPCDASKEEDVSNFIEDVIIREGKIDYLVNTVGGYHPKQNILDGGTELLKQQMNLNFFSTFYFTYYALENMAANKYGRIVSIGAMPALAPTPGKFAYSVSKAAVVNLMQTIAEEYKDDNINAYTIIPGIIDTPANRKSMPDSDFSKWTSSQDIADTILSCFSDTPDSINGGIIKMYGKL